jgi:hypothetical protein
MLNFVLQPEIKPRFFYLQLVAWQLHRLAYTGEMPSECLLNIAANAENFMFDSSSGQNLIGSEFY